jgi:hypothetical protein
MPCGRGFLHPAAALFLVAKIVFAADSQCGKEVYELPFIAGPAADRVTENNDLADVRHT